MYAKMIPQKKHLKNIFWYSGELSFFLSAWCTTDLLRHTIEFCHASDGKYKYLYLPAAEQKLYCTHCCPVIIIERTNKFENLVDNNYNASILFIFFCTLTYFTIIICIFAILTLKTKRGYLFASKQNSGGRFGNHLVSVW